MKTILELNFLNLNLTFTFPFSRKFGVFSVFFEPLRNHIFTKQILYVVLKSKKNVMPNFIYWNLSAIVSLFKMPKIFHCLLIKIENFGKLLCKRAAHIIKIILYTHRHRKRERAAQRRMYRFAWQICHWQMQIWVNFIDASVLKTNHGYWLWQRQQQR